MNRRSFFKFLGIGAATAVVAPKMLIAAPRKSISFDAIGAQELESVRHLTVLLPEQVQIPNELFIFHKYLEEKKKFQLGLKDIQALQRIKRNA